MIFERVLGNVENTNVDGCHVEKVYLNNEEMLKRIIRVTSDHGNDYGISLSQGEKLRDGDILMNDWYNVVVVKFNSEDVLVIKPKDMNQMGKIAHEIGNKHLPAQFIDETMIIQYDSVVEETLKKQNLNILI